MFAIISVSTILTEITVIPIMTVIRVNALEVATHRGSLGLGVLASNIQATRKGPIVPAFSGL